MSKLVLTQSQQVIAAKAQSMGLKAIFALADELLLDIDYPYETVNLPELTPRVYLINQKLQIVSSCVTRSKSGNAHVYIKLNRSLTGFERIVVQALMGSDRVREVLSALQLQAGSKGCTCLFETQEEYSDVYKWRSIIGQASVLYSDYDQSYYQEDTA